MTRTEKRHLRNGLLFTSPGIIGFVMFVIYPVLSSLYFAFCNYTALAPAQWIGLNNFRVMIRDEKLLLSLNNTVLFGLMSVPLGIFSAFVLANLLNQKVSGLPVFRTIFYLPSVVPAVASAVLWIWVLNPQFGLLNAALIHLGISNPPGWLSDPQWSKPALAIMGVWGVGGWMIIFLAGLQDVPSELHEAAQLDGASALQTWRNVTIPFMTPHLFFASVMGLIGVTSYFAQPMVMTGGGPAESTLFFAQYLFQNAFQFFKMGYACAMAWALGLLLMLLTALWFRLSSRWVYYGGD
ncbi:MAG: sugar ABC transporter permease [Armatimonadetes bacterium]|jgi:multiple sugar transport system permease protein|nr:sugar ABC transporter permease [Armatimonadota bacterium]HOC31385.1 sugar ABC transporter permease [Armatimonadota bacterium]